MSTAALAMRRNQNLYRQPARLQMGPLSASFLVVAIVAVLALIYLNQVSKTAMLGNRLAQLETQKTQVASDQEALSVEAARLQSIQQIQSSKTVAQMTPATGVTYAK
jgi:hypothetical protein